LKERQFDLVLCIESLHCFSDISLVLKGAKALLEESNGSLVIADLFDKRDIERIEA
jgi:2-polyprenyl-3-methyl-5-hydroxy-6-metoxy-1,4-benzoquinol methylase